MVSTAPVITIQVKKEVALARKLREGDKEYVDEDTEQYEEEEDSA